MVASAVAAARILTRAAYARTAHELHEDSSGHAEEAVDEPSTCAQSIDPELAEELTEEMIEKMESMGASDGIVTLWREQDAKAVKLSALADPAVLTPALRDGTFRYIEKFARAMGCPWNAVYSCVTIFDIHCKRCAVAVRDLPALVAVVVGIVKKADDATTCVGFARFAQYATQVAQWLARLPGHEDMDVAVTEDQLQAMELRVLNSIGWFIQFPTVETWASAILARLNVLSGSKYVHSMQWIWQTHLFITMRLVLLRQAASPELTAGCAASGLFCLGLAAARLIPPRAFKPEQVDEAEWEVLIAECQPQGQAGPCCLPTEQTHILLEQLPLATGRSHEELCVDCAKVAGVMRHAMADINRQRMQGQPMYAAAV